LNIAYTSMQAMEPVDGSEIAASSDKSDGKTVALYAHVPFCTAECYYCHYYKQFRKSKSEVDAYLDSLEDELSLHEKRFGGLEAASLYVGGGTPSYMTAEQIDRFFSAIDKHVSVPRGIEVSFEIHPESATEDRLAVLKSHGVNRINIGVESFNDEILASENRRHTAEEARMAFERIRAAGFDNINLDLIYGLKGQTVDMWEETLDEIAKLGPASATMYFLRLKKGTPEYNMWKKYPETFPSDDDLLLMHAMNFERMEDQLGYIQNPVDWFIRNPSYFHTYQDHNWRRSDETELLGIGPSAYSYVDGWQYYNVNDTQKWQAQLDADTLPIWKGENLQGDEPMRRTVMLGIKMGMDRDGFERTYGIDVVNAFSDTWRRLEELGLVTITTDAVELTYLGKLLADEVGQQFYSDTMKRRMAAIDPTLVSTTWPQFNP
ncbi:MAG: coproporphyrinogen III oxidase family protein, partial [Candidatus Roizmanbacteria bacterium]|nr:coproporphyrinogen III oxidase family protein [Candidatus Roizmanbacteria bacterium]